MIFENKLSVRHELRQAIDQAYRMDEGSCVEHLLLNAQLSPEVKEKIVPTAKKLITAARARRNFVDDMLQEYPLSSTDGIALLSLVEALLRIPDNKTGNQLIVDKLTAANWQEHIGSSDVKAVNFFTNLLHMESRLLKSKVPLKKANAAVTRVAIKQAMGVMSRHFIMGKTIKQALQNSQSYIKKGFVFSFDMLGEAARTMEDADQYYRAYHEAICAAGEQITDKTVSHRQKPSISVKLSALHPRYEFAQRRRVLDELALKLHTLAMLAKEQGIGLTVDAEEAERLDISLDIIEAVFCDSSLNGWEGFGVALQAYQKRAWYVIDWLAHLAEQQQRRLFVRLVKGAYWDSEIKQAQMLGLREYPVFTRKESTDVSFLACTQKLLGLAEYLRPAFATHNAYTIAYILSLAGSYRHFEFQCLYGMGQGIYQDFIKEEELSCRVYAPVGHYDDLLPYLMRRLLENGANSSFLHQLYDENITPEALLSDPVSIVSDWKNKRHSKIPLPSDIYGQARKNSQGIDLTSYEETIGLSHELTQFQQTTWTAGIQDTQATKGEKTPVYSPNNLKDCVGWVHDFTSIQAEQALASASEAMHVWDECPVEDRCACIQRAADILQERQAELIALMVREAGKSVPDAVSEVREAIDFCRYYAQQAEQYLAKPVVFEGYTGEQNELSFHGKGVMVCISPWNFPLAIFTGQIVACLVTGNAVIAKPAEQTPLIASVAVEILHAAGVPSKVLQLVPGPGDTIGQLLVSDPRTSGVLFTGSTQTARAINTTLAQRDGPIAQLIAETGGQNVMVVDSSALLELAVDDIVFSAFNSAGQRCSALRVLYVQEDIADKLIKMLAGAMAELKVGDSGLLKNDVGPVIDKRARDQLQAHVKHLDKIGKLIYKTPLGEACTEGMFFAPHAYEIESLEQLNGEVFGPIMHVIRYRAKALDQVITAINQTGYGLTFGIQSRISATQKKLQQEVRAGNCYINRNMIGAVVGLQPFGGEGLSGTGPKAGGPHYLYRLCNERTLTNNTAAIGGDVKLLDICP